MKIMSRRSGAVAIAVLALGLWAGAAQAASIVKVELWDKGMGASMATNLKYATPVPDMSAATMGVKATPTSVPAGIVSFQVTNSSKDTVHEMIVMYLADPTQPLPYVDKDSKVDEDKAGDKGEVSELDPGASGTLTVALKPGTYLLICNVAGHFAAGMWTEFTVTK
ncbi:MAG: sulfocyanin-like copper-binding protein [Devosia sp.]|nr:sulfocyanin-like copper-binding protein [Devosia sp.]